MHVPNSQHRSRDRWRPPLAAALMLTLAALTGSAQAVEFDASLRAPMMKSQGELKSQAQNFSARYKAIRESAPEQLLEEPALAREHFDLAWKVKRAIDERRPLDELAEVGIVSDVNGYVRIDFNAYPQWLPYEERFAALLVEPNMEGLGKELMQRGFRASDVAALGSYLSTHDLERASAERALPVALSFNRLVQKFDRTKRAVEPALVLSFVYQREKVRSDATREWAAGLLQTLDAQRVRILFEYVSEPESFGYWTPTEQSIALSGILSMVRRPDFEQQAIAEARAKGAQP
jgi:hypothetical protein